MTNPQKKKRKYNLRHIKQNRCYSFYDIAELLDITHHTVCIWHSKSGLKTIDNRIPYLVHGTELYEHCKDINKSFERPCKDGELYCFGCQRGREPKDNTIYLHRSGNVFKIESECGTCGKVQSSYTNEQSLFKYRRLFKIIQSDGKNRKEYVHADCNPQLKEAAGNETI